MVTFSETVIGPAIRVLHHLMERQRFYRIRFNSGERVLVLIAAMPSPSVEIVRLVGVIPWQTIWGYNPRRAGSYGDYLHKLKAMFLPKIGGSEDPLDYIRAALLQCRSVTEARTLLSEREQLANSSITEIGVARRRHGPTSAASAGQRRPEAIYPHTRSPAERAAKPAVPDRYRIRDDAKGRSLTCVEAPTVTVRAQRGFAVSAAQARNYQAGTIFLDGAAQGGPFVDAQKEIYNLDHHEGCIRSFMLATCEQAMVLIRKVVDLRKRDWIVLANDADLDAVFAIWVLLNHFRINNDPQVRARVMPLLRLEGAIDAHGLDLQDLAALPPDLFHETTATLKQLQEREADLKSEGAWSKIDLVEYIAGRLHAIDRLIYSPEHFEGLHEIEEIARVEIANGSVAIACHSDAGIYELEQQLRKLYGDRLGILILHSVPSAYTLRQVDQMLPATLERVYERLNLIDPAVGGGLHNRWGGSPEIGGSPRSTGTRLTPAQVTETVRQAFRQPTIVDIFCGMVRAVALGLAVMLPPLALIFIGSRFQYRPYGAGESVLAVAVILSVAAAIVFILKARRAPGLYGWRAAAGLDWLAVLPAALIGAATGGVWVPASPNLNSLTACAILLLPAAAEILFRGAILGDVASRLPIQTSGGPWFVSWPTLISGVLYALVFMSFLSFSSGQPQMSHWFVSLPAAVIFGIASGMARERSGSIVAPVLLHWLGAAALLLFRRLSF